MQLRELTTLPEDLSSIPNTHMAVTQTSVTPVPGDIKKALFWPPRVPGRNTHIHASYTRTHKIKINLKSK